MLALALVLACFGLAAPAGAECDHPLFRAPVEYGAGVLPRSVAVGDFDGDTDLDLAVANSGSGDVSILLGNGDGTFAAAVSYGAGSGPLSVAVGDFDGRANLRFEERRRVRLGSA